MLELNSNNIVSYWLNHKDTGIKTGLTNFDNYTGGLRLGRLYLLSAASGIGKTSFMVSILAEALKTNPNEKFLYIATEQTINEIGVKFLAHYSNINERDITTGKLTPNQIEALSKISLNNIYFEYYEDAGFDLVNCLNCAVNNGIKYVFYDYLGAIADLSDDKEWRTLETLADTLKRFTNEHNICIFTATQCSTDIQTCKPPEIYNERFIANSKGIARKADVGFIMLKEDGMLRVDMYKNRQMESRIILKFKMDYSTTRLKEVSYDKK